MNTSRTIILASTSPSRQALLQSIGLPFQVEASSFEEQIPTNVEPKELVQLLSQGKARAVAARHTDAIIIGADTVGVLNGEILGKPRDDAHAREMLAKMSGQCALSITGFTIIDTKTKKEISRTVETKVFFRKLTSEEIEGYIASGETAGHAAAYAIQGLGKTLVERIEGDYFNVAGLPIAAVVETLREFGVHPGE